jgi:hypothetical protein
VKAVTRPRATRSVVDEQLVCTAAPMDYTSGVTNELSRSDPKDELVDVWSSAVATGSRCTYV